jgi:aminoglycoside phosphotransferase (APT) family kinase protein
MTELPPDVLARLGPAPEELTRFGSSRVLRGNGLVAKFGPEERLAREAFLFGDARALLPVEVPVLVAHGPGWILMEAAGGEVGSAADVAPLARLAPVHELFDGSTGIEDPRFRDIFGRERDGLLAAARAEAPAGMPEPLASLLDDPSPLTAIVDAEPRTLVHGDAWAGNVLVRGPGDYVWLDWEEAGAGPAALDLAVWLYGSPWVPGSASPEGNLGAYVSARTTPVDLRAFKRAVDAATVLAFLLLDLAIMGEGERGLTEQILERRNELARDLL